MNSHNAVNDCLFYLHSSGAVDWPEDNCKTLFLCAQETVALDNLPGNTQCQQHFKPFHDALSAKGRNVSSNTDFKASSFNRVYLLAPKQVGELQFLVAQGISLCEEGGVFTCCAANNAGGSRLAKLLKTLGLEPSSESKHKAKVVWAEVNHSSINRQIIDKHLSYGEMRKASHGMFSCPGIFGWDKIDKGSEILVSYLPDDMKGYGADFGCGYGYLSNELLGRSEKIKKLYAVDADYRALDACRKNLERFSSKTEFLWEDLSKPVSGLKDIDWIIMNPPFHEARKTSPDLGGSFIKTAFNTLHKGGHLYMVANAHLPYEQTLASLFYSVECLSEHSGFKIFKAIK